MLATTLNSYNPRTFKQMKKQLIQALWAVAQGQPQVQGEKTIYPSIREQLNAIKILMSLDDWEEAPPMEIVEEKPLPQVASYAAKEVATVETPASKGAKTPQKTEVIPDKAADTSEKTGSIPKETKPRTYYRGTYEEWLAQKELLEKLLLEEKTKKIQAKLGKMTKSKSTPPPSSV